MALSKELYPDVTEAGGLSPALQRALEAGGSPLRVQTFSDGGRHYARLQQGQRSSQVYIALKERLFTVDFWHRGVMMADGGTPHLQDVALSIDSWITGQLTTSKLRQKFSFATPAAGAEHFEAGTEVDWRWNEYEEHIRCSDADLARFFEAARTTPQLRQLFPFISLGRLCFSRCTGYPYTNDCPHVRAKSDGLFEVWLGSNRLGEGTPHDAVTLVVKNLPKGCDRAVAGTADDFECA